MCLCPVTLYSIHEKQKSTLSEKKTKQTAPRRLLRQWWSCSLHSNTRPMSDRLVNDGRHLLTAESCAVICGLTSACCEMWKCPHCIFSTSLVIVSSALILAQLRDEIEENSSQTFHELAQRFGISYATTRVHLHQLGKKWNCCWSKMRDFGVPNGGFSSILSSPPYKVRNHFCADVSLDVPSPKGSRIFLAPPAPFWVHSELIQWTTPKTASDSYLTGYA